MTVAEIISQVKIDIHQDGTSGFFSDSELLDLVNEGYVDFCRFTEAREKQTTQTVDALQGLVSLPSDFLDSRQIRWSSNRQLVPIEERRLDDDQRDWFYKIASYPEYCLYFNWDNLRLTPIPSSEGTLTFRYAFMPDTLEESDEPQIPKVWHDVFVDYVDAQCFFTMKEYDNGAKAWTSYLARREKAKAQSRTGQRTPDTFYSQRPVDIFNYPKWDQGYRTR